MEGFEVAELLEALIALLDEAVLKNETMAGPLLTTFLYHSKAHARPLASRCYQLAA
jgi:hypothetical protein